MNLKFQKFQKTGKFDKELRRLSPIMRKKFFKNLKLLLLNPQHPSLNFEKIQEPLHSIRINKNFRAIFYYPQKDIISFTHISNHDIYKKLKNL